MILLAPAKVNLHLRVIKRRPDGYHDIETLFEKIALFDKITLRPSKKIKIRSKNHNIPTGKNSLLYRAAVAFKERFNVSKGVEVRLEKRIPVAAGFGGGSSDAASLLKGLAMMWLGKFNMEDLMKIAGKLGADIPFFLSDSSFAYARGIGDKIKPLSLRNKFWHLIVCPPKKLLSGDVYSSYDRKRSYLTKRPRLIRILSPAPDGSGRPAAKRALGYDIMESLLFNDLERAVIKISPLVGKLKEFIKGLNLPHTLVSGSGPGIFSLFKERKEALIARDALVKGLPFVRKKGWQIFVVSTV
ncbi:MAG: 4-(cytidine 5'-diphospho)-2-C-methyl-D-erythritol kinase [Candidatus Omnitrophica bacterium]|nr:4-(cytidine 5'-diphospho)-2-C-methyl-D-erythritol kinase [Candidatus Omnitrophota bacterium]